MRRYIDAVWSYRSALTLEPNRCDTWTNLGNALTTLKQCKTAIICHERAIALSARNDPLSASLKLRRWPSRAGGTTSVSSAEPLVI